MRTGDLKHSIIFQESTESEDGMGGFSNTWSDLYPCRAAIWPIKSSEQLDAMKLELGNVNRVRIRHPRMLDITADMRIVHVRCFCGAEETFNIVSILNPNKANRTLDMLVTEET